MSTQENVRTDSKTAEAVSQGMVILAECGHARARIYFKEVGIKADIAERMLLIRYDRRRVSLPDAANVERGAAATPSATIAGAAQHLR